jgi:hypothetical protein
MADSTNVQDDPTSVQLVAYYIDGIYQTSVAPVIARFPNAVLVPISAIGTNAGIVGDVEPGCMSPAQGVAWVQMRRATGVDPTLYVNETYGWGPVRQAFQAAGVAEPHYWVANYDGVQSIPAGAVAKQYANPTLTHGHFDLSVVADYWPGVDAGLFGSGSYALGTLGNETWVGGGQPFEKWFTDMAARVSDIEAAIKALPAAQPEPVEPSEAAGVPFAVDLTPVLQAISVLQARVDVIATKLDNAGKAL